MPPCRREVSRISERVTWGKPDEPLRTLFTFRRIYDVHHVEFVTEDPKMVKTLNKVIYVPEIGCPDISPSLLVEGFRQSRNKQHKGIAQSHPK